jgi:hypothetical protein
MSYVESIRMVNQIYQDLDLTKNEKITRLFKESTLYGERINILGREEDPNFFNIRHDPEKSNLATISVVPTVFADRFRSSLQGIELYMLKVPLYWRYQYSGSIKPFISQEGEVDGLFEIEAPYNSITGLTIEQFDEAHTLSL